MDEAWLRASALFRLAEEMGRELGENRGRALRSSLDIEPARGVLERSEFLLSHRRGEVLVAGVLTALVRVWARRLKELRADAIGRSEATAVRRIAEEGAAAADYLLTLTIRALDYTPPIDLRCARRASTQGTA